MNRIEKGLLHLDNLLNVFWEIAKTIPAILVALTLCFAAILVVVFLVRLAMMIVF